MGTTVLSRPEGPWHEIGTADPGSCFGTVLLEPARRLQVRPAQEGWIRRGGGRRPSAPSSAPTGARRQSVPGRSRRRLWWIRVGTRTAPVGLSTVDGSGGQGRRAIPLEMAELPAVSGAARKRSRDGTWPISMTPWRRACRSAGRPGRAHRRRAISVASANSCHGRSRMAVRSRRPRHRRRRSPRE
jgi:hypothetical protein